MPTTTGGETINERLTRLRAELVRVRATIARSETNGGSFNIGGAAVTQIAYERAISRERDLNAQIAQLESRLTGSLGGLAMATAVTRMH
jgi:hypothetical protein